MVTLEKRTISYLSVSVRFRVIDPFSEMKREYNTILDDADSANRNNLSHLRALHDPLRETFSQGDQYIKEAEHSLAGGQR